MKRIVLSFLYMFVAYAVASLAFISLDMYPEFASFGLSQTLHSASRVSVFPLALAFMARSLMEFFSDAYCKRTGKRFLIAVLISAFISVLGYFLVLSTPAVIVFFAAHLVVSAAIFTIPDLCAMKKPDKSDVSSEKRKNKRKGDSEAKGNDSAENHKAKPSGSDENQEKKKIRIFEKKSKADGSAAKSRADDSDLQSDEPSVPYVINIKTNERVMPTSTLQKHVRPRGAFNPDSFMISNDRVPLAQSQNLESGTGSSDSSSAAVAEGEGGFEALWNQRWCVTGKPEPDGYGSSRAVASDASQPSRAVSASESSPKPVAKTSVASPSQVSASVSAQKPVSSASHVQDDEIVNNVDDDDDDDFRIEYDDDSDDEVIYTDDDYDEDDDDVEEKAHIAAARLNSERTRIEREKAEKEEHDRIEREKMREEARLAAERKALEKAAEEERKAAERAAEQERLAKEKAAEEARLAAERAAAEEQRRAAEQERLAKEKAAEEERLAAERAAEEERKAQEKAAEEERKAAERAAKEAEREAQRQAKERERAEREAERAREAERKALEEAKEAELRAGVGRLKREDKSIRQWHYELPPDDLLKHHKSKNPPLTDEELQRYEAKLIEALDAYQIKGKSDGYVSGPTVTLFKVELAPGVKVNRIQNVSSDIARYLGISSAGLRIIPTIEGTHDIGIEMPNPSRQTVSFVDTLEGLRSSRAQLPFALGKSVKGDDVVIDIAKAPHLLLAGTTGSGKSVSLNSMVSSLLYVRSPEDVRFIVVDPKQVELVPYNNIPHLLAPVITDPKAAIRALDYCVEEMERRYTVLTREGVRNIIGYNDKIRQRHMKREKMPYIIVIIDEFADIVQVVGKDLEQRVMRLAAKARAIGIHLVLATQRPSVDVVTGTLKNNIPTRVAFKVSSNVDSKTILDSGGAEKLLGQGDMLLRDSSSPDLIRIQGSFLDDSEVEAVTDYVRSQDTPDYIKDDCLDEPPEPAEASDGDDADMSEKVKLKWTEKHERLLQTAWDIAMEQGGISTSYIQRRLGLGYNLAATIADEMENRGIIGPQQGSKKRELLQYKE